MYSTEYAATIVLLLGIFLPKFGIEIDSTSLGNFVQVGAALLSGLWLFYKRHSRGGVSALGVRR